MLVKFLKKNLKSEKNIYINKQYFITIHSVSDLHKIHGSVDIFNCCFHLYILNALTLNAHKSRYLMSNFFASTHTHTHTQNSATFMVNYFILNYKHKIDILLVSVIVRLNSVSVLSLKKN